MIYYIMDRPTWDEYFSTLVKVTATRSPCKKLKVGCILVKENRIISQGYNGYLPGCEHKQVIRDNHEIATIHAEQNAIIDCAKRGVSSNECTAYITHYPCYNCTKMMCAAGISNIKYLKNYNNDELSDYFAKSCNVSIEQLII